MTNGFVQHVAVEESTSIQWVNMEQAAVSNLPEEGQLLQTDQKNISTEPAVCTEAVLFQYWGHYLLYMYMLLCVRAWFSIP